MGSPRIRQMPCRNRLRAAPVESGFGLGLLERVWAEWCDLGGLSAPFFVVTIGWFKRSRLRRPPQVPMSEVSIQDDR